MIVSNLIWSDVTISTKDNPDVKYDLATIDISSELSINKKKYRTIHIQKHEVNGLAKNCFNNLTFFRPKIIKLSQSEIVIHAHNFNVAEQLLSMNKVVITARF